MSLRLLTVLLASVTLSSCFHYNYAVNKDRSPIPYENQYPSDDNSSYEFDSTLYDLGFNGYSNAVTISHLTDLQLRYQSAPSNTSHSTFLSFGFDTESGVEVLVDTVVLQHYTDTGELITGELIEPNAIETTMDKCRDVIGCRGYILQHYAKGLPRNITEKVSFTLSINGVEDHIDYVIPLEKKYHYSDLGVLMGA